MDVVYDGVDRFRYVILVDQGVVSLAESHQSLGRTAVTGLSELCSMLTGLINISNFVDTCFWTGSGVATCAI